MIHKVALIAGTATAIGQATAIAGLGLSQMPAFLAAEAISTGNLVEVLNPYRPPEVPVWICYLDRRFVAPRIRAFVDFMAMQKEAFTTTC
jgi:DNA-binding transcriptional LysR family regulator